MSKCVIYTYFILHLFYVKGSKIPCNSPKDDHCRQWITVTNFVGICEHKTAFESIRPKLLLLADNSSGIIDAMHITIETFYNHVSFLFMEVRKAKFIHLCILDVYKYSDIFSKLGSGNLKFYVSEGWIVRNYSIGINNRYILHINEPNMTLSTNTGERRRRDSKEDNVFDKKFKEMKNEITSRISREVEKTQQAREHIQRKFDKMNSKIDTMLELQNTVHSLRDDLHTAENRLSSVVEKIEKLEAMNTGSEVCSLHTHRSSFDPPLLHAKK